VTLDGCDVVHLGEIGGLDSEGGCSRDAEAGGAGLY
jgi:hypothetical protein